MVYNSMFVVYSVGLVDVYSSHSIDTRHHATHILDVRYSLWSETVVRFCYQLKLFGVRH